MPRESDRGRHTGLPGFNVFASGPSSFAFSFGNKRGMAMRTLIASCGVAAALMVLAVPARAGGDSAPVTVLIRAGTETKYAEVVKILKALDEARVGAVELEVPEPKAAGVSAVIRTRSDTPYKAVVRTLEALQRAGVRKVAISPKP
jgi:biopolymer transport protein ExbD